ncbi:PorP/SprF family type IX secretion system membrane protein [Flavobacterium sp. 3HN19-14]|uniref:PorP/SprF family type IX secretion system membrane protein n=1 Tax=Flavobacterium sp. 3HN19-14 TaxID=3448133 RepID=UPI003EE0EE6B
MLNTNVDNKVNASIGAGIFFYTDNWYAGLSVPNFLRGDYYDDVQESVNTERLHYYAIGGYVFTFSDNFKFKPAVMLKAVSGAPVSADFSANFLIQEKLTLGASYRLDDSVSALAGFQITNSIFAGYSFDYTVTDLNKYNDGSHEIIIRFQLMKAAKRIKSPRFF